MWYSNVEEMWPSGHTDGNTYKMPLTYGEIHEYVAGWDTSLRAGGG
jgi:hypothetical protein